MSWSDITGTAADWVMASAAVYAAFNAKQWFSQRSHTKGFDKAEEILSDIDSVYQATYKSVLQLHKTLEYTKFIQKGLSIPEHSKNKEFENLQNSHQEILDKIIRINEELDIIERWSIKVQDKEFIKSTITSIRDVNVCGVNAFITVQSIVFDAINRNDKGVDFGIKAYSQHYAEYLHDFSLMEKYYFEFKTRKFVSFFKVT